MTCKQSANTTFHLHNGEWISHLSSVLHMWIYQAAVKVYSAHMLMVNVTHLSVFFFQMGTLYLAYLSCDL
jgi:hypothetical protein